MEPDAHAEPSAERHGETEECGGIAEVIPRPAASIVIAILPGHADPFRNSRVDCSKGAREIAHGETPVLQPI